MNRPPTRAAAALAALAVAALAFTLVSGCASEAPDVAPLIRPVRTMIVFADGTERTRTFSGTAQAGIESRLSFKVAGTVTDVRVQVGDRVDAGDVIARLDPTDFDLQLEDADASVERTEAEERRAAATYERVRQLYENDNASKNDLDAARASAEASAAAARSARKNRELARQRRAYTVLTAPIGGAISAVRAEANENVSAGQVVAVLSAGERPEVAFSVPELLITRVREGAAAAVSFDALPDRPFDAVVTEVGVAADGGATYPVTARLKSATSEVRPGMAAEVALRFAAGGEGPAIRVPPSAVLEDRDGRYAFTVTRADGDLGTVHRRPVRVGELTEDGLEILDGLSDGDVVVTAGVTKIQDGLTVRVPGNAP